jgi:hypothetical protein
MNWCDASKRSIPSRRRSAFVQQSLEQALPPDRGNDEASHLSLDGKPENVPGVLVASWSLLIRGILATLRQKSHLSTCPNLAGHLCHDLPFPDRLTTDSALTIFPPLGRRYLSVS